MQLPARIVLAKTALRLGRPNASALLADAMRDAAATAEIQYIAPVHIAYIELAATLGPKSLAKEHFHALSDSAFEGLNDWVWAEYWFWSVQSGLEPSPKLIKNLPHPYQLLAAEEPALAAKAFGGIGMSYMEAWCHSLDGSKDALNNAARLCQIMESDFLRQKIGDHAETNGMKINISATPRGPYGAARIHPLGLTQREQDVLGLLIKGVSNKDIAANLDRSKRTVENHVSAVLTKFNAKNRTDVILRVQNEPWLLMTETP